MSLKYNKVLVLGTTSGIGWALAEKIVLDGKQVIIVGRRQEKLDEISKFVQDATHSGAPRSRLGHSELENPARL